MIDAVAPAALGEIEIPVRRLDKYTRTRGVLWLGLFAGHADAEGHLAADRRGRMRNRDSREGSAYVFSHPHRPFPGRIRQDHGEFFASVAGDKIIGAKA